MLPAMAIAQEGGAVTITIGDNTYDFPLSESQSDWSGPISFANIYIDTRPMDEGTRELFNHFSLGFDYFGEQIDYAEATLIRVIDGELVYYYANAEDTDIVLTIEEESVDGEFLTIAGNAEMTMGTSENFGRDIDLSDPLSLSASFAVILGPVD